MSQQTVDRYVRWVIRHVRDEALKRIGSQLRANYVTDLRGAGYDGDHRHCEIEADHLHNIPEYVAGGDAANHLYYLAREVPYYLTKADLTAVASSELLRWYVPLWIELESLVPVRGSPWEKEWLELKARGWNYGRPLTP
jgi:hypothetical protein